MRLSREIIEAIKDRSDIVDLIGSYVTLRRAGSNYNGLCPFHSEKTPSFTVFPDTQSFFCFGCEAGGDAFTFIMRSENLEYPEAVEFLAKRAGIDLPEEGGEESDRRGISRRRLFEMNLAAARFFRQCLFDPVLGAPAMAYLRDQRGLKPDIIRRFGLGYAPNDFQALLPVLKQQGYTEAEMKEGFLCGISQSGRAYDYFRNRVMFPVFDMAGNVIAFSGRDIGGDSRAKYLNSSDTPGFQKRKNLFALNFARNHCAEQMILCEGNMDVVSLHAAGFENAVASLGTALTDEQARLMAKYTKQVVIAYDADAAGQRAAQRAMGIFEKVGLDVRVLVMQDAKDPDEFIKKFGADRFAGLLKKSRTGFEYKLNSVLSRYDVEKPDEKIRAADELCGVVARVYSAAEQEVYIQAISRKLDLPADSLRKDVERMIARRVKEAKRENGHMAQLSALGIGDKINPEAAGNVRGAAAEDAIIGLLLLYGEHRRAVKEGTISLTGEDFITSFGRRAFQQIMALETDDGGYDFSLLGQFFNPDEMGRLAKLEQNRRALSENSSAVLRAAVNTLREEKQRQGGQDATPLDDIGRLLAEKRKQKK